MESDDIASRFWNQPQKGSEEARRESLFIDDIIQKTHIQRELDVCISGVKTAFDGGAGSGRFSVYLAKRGIRVTHFDISAPMLDEARKYADREGVQDLIVFQQGGLSDLSMFADESFDLVMSFDAPISYTYPRHRDVIKSLARMTRDRLVISVSSRLGTIPYLLSPSQKTQYLLDPDSDDPLVQWYIKYGKKALESFSVDIDRLHSAFKTGLLQDPKEVESAFQKGDSPWPATYLFMPDELEDILEANGIHDVRLAGPGAFARSIPNEVLVRIMKDPAQK